MWAVSAAVPKLPEGVTKTELSFLLKRFLIGLIFGLPVGAVGTLVVQRSFRQGFWQGLLTGLGSGSLSGTEQEMTAVIEATIENGINYFDIAPSERTPFFAYSKAFTGRREKIITQMHFGAVYSSGKCGCSMTGGSADKPIGGNESWKKWKQQMENRFLTIKH